MITTNAFKIFKMNIHRDTKFIRKKTMIAKKQNNFVENRNDFNKTKTTIIFDEKHDDENFL